MFGMKDFVTWLTRELNERGWTNSELARRAELVPSTISMVISGRTNPGWEFCLGVARAFGFPPETVLRRAGLLPAVPARVQGEQEMLGIFRLLSENQRQMILSMLRALAPRRGFVLATDVTARSATAEESVEYAVSREIEAELLEQFRRLPPRDQERILADVENIAHAIITEGDNGTTT